jgi:hypothetical protein
MTIAPVFDLNVSHFEALDKACDEWVAKERARDFVQGRVEMDFSVILTPMTDELLQGPHGDDIRSTFEVTDDGFVTLDYDEETCIATHTEKEREWFFSHSLNEIIVFCWVFGVSFFELPREIYLRVLRKIAMSPFHPMNAIRLAESNFGESDDENEVFLAYPETMKRYLVAVHRLNTMNDYDPSRFYERIASKKTVVV